MRRLKSALLIAGPLDGLSDSTTSTASSEAKHRSTNPPFVENFNRLPAEHKEDYHLTEDIAEKATTWMRNQRALAPDRPFFMYWAPGAVHGPHHVARSWADKYKGQFDDGWDTYRKRVFERQKERGYIPADAELTPRPDSLAAWDDIPEAEKPFQRRLMEVFAGYCEHTDVQVGRLIDELDELGIRENTIVFYIWGDNGSSAEGQGGTISEFLAQSGTATTMNDHLRVVNENGGLEALGGPKFDNMYHAGWAWAGSTPYRSTKLVAAHFGGTRNPLAVSWPKSIKADAKPRSQFHHVNDVVPTIYEILSITAPNVVDGITQDPMDGISMHYAFQSADAPGRKQTQYFEIMGSRAIYHDGFIASAFGPRIPWKPGIDPNIFQWSPDQNPWELYDLTNDFSQANDLASAKPGMLSKLKQLFLSEAENQQSVPNRWWTMDRPAPGVHATESGYRILLHQRRDRGPRSDRSDSVSSSVVTIETNLQAECEGVLYSIGGYAGGVAAWVDQGQVFYEYNLYEVERTQVRNEHRTTDRQGPDRN